MTRHQMTFVRIARTESLHAVRALVGSFTSVPPTMFLVVRWMTKLAMTIGTSEARQVGMNQHVIVEAMLASEDGTTPSAFVRFNP
jgi:hypothetical protein